MESGESSVRLTKQATLEFTIIFFFVPPKFCLGIFLNFSWDLGQMLTQNFGGAKKSIMVNSKMAYTFQIMKHIFLIN